MTTSQNTIWSLITVTGTICSRYVRTGKDGIVRFSIRNDNGFFYIQCKDCALKHDQIRLLRQGTRVIITGRLTSYFDKQSKKHQTAIIAQSLSILRDGRTIQILRNIKIITN